MPANDREKHIKEEKSLKNERFFKFRGFSVSTSVIKLSHSAFPMQEVMILKTNESRDSVINKIRTQLFQCFFNKMNNK